MRAGGDLVMSVRSEAMCSRRRLRLLMSHCRVLESLPRVLMSRQVTLFPVLLSNTVGMRSQIVQFGRSLVILVV
jgi:hypothetical protein